MKHDETTHDALFSGALSLRQPARKRGYRVNVDALLLAGFVAKKARHAVDLGSGVGGVGLSLLHLGLATRLTMVELDAGLAALATTNAADNGWAERVDVLEGDVRTVKVADADLVVCNPPYVPPGRGRAPAAPVRGAKYGALDVFVDAARRAAGRRARIAFVYPAIEATTLLVALRARGIEPKRLRAVHGRPQDAARVVLVEGALGKPGGLSVEPPLFETTATGARSDEVAALLARPRA